MQQIVRSFSMAFNHLPKYYRFIVWLLTIIIFIFLVWRPCIYSLILESFIGNIITIEDYQLCKIKSEVSKPVDQSNLKNKENFPKVPKDKLDKHVEREVGIHKYIISTGDTISSIFTQYSIDIADIAILIRKNPTLRHLKIGQSLSWILTSDGNLKRLIWNVSRYETRTFDRIKGGFKESINNITGKWQNMIITGQLNGSFIISASAAGLTGSDINAVIEALQWQLDFRKLHKGDRFSVLISRKIFNGKSTKSQLLGVRLHSSGKDYYAFRADDGKFYNRDAAGLVRGFMRFPTVKQFRVSSNFNLKRLNPVTGVISPHRGVDFAVPIGTPLLAVGDGEVIVSKRDNTAGNYVTIRHGRQYITRYMHLKKLFVKPGQKVKRGDRIALSGNTGRSTGPHLHYELWINHKAVNPLTAKLPDIESLTGRDRTEYLAHVKQILPQLQLN
ncbi:Murein DD-endopeptidase MepM [Candidatus Gullanella endobia]|uniref:Murein DD-endopeptidase MepM n=1 Tax=Candidatus Gullanella endobia TaxID=1070130 RepID=A0A143WQG8_9ENTR|nr:murein DD-endopeptidase MepM [Candidatus Gullanella endobia]CUX95982.1 Murein DD-endopeptidase MepM [Candidatus Gullanella endobia]